MQEKSRAAAAIRSSSPTIGASFVATDNVGLSSSSSSIELTALTLYCCCCCRCRRRVADIVVCRILHVVNALLLWFSYEIKLY